MADVATDGGSESFTLTTANLPAHTHGISGGTQSAKVTGTTKTGEGAQGHPVTTQVIQGYGTYKVTNNNDGSLVIPTYLSQWAQAIGQDAAGNIYGTHTHTFDATIDITFPSSTTSTGAGKKVSLNPWYYGCYMWLRTS